MTGRPWLEVKNDPARSRPNRTRRGDARARRARKGHERTLARSRSCSADDDLMARVHTHTHTHGATGINGPLDEDINSLLVEVHSE